ncbi:MAG: rhodanese-like domain-containing protein [Candidatus Deferrimicrobiaceae bacterium]
MVKRAIALSTLALVTLIFVCGSFAADVPKDPKKQTPIGKYVTSLEAYDMWKANPGKVKIIDVRTPEEYVFVGHAAMAVNIPSQLWNGKFDGEKKKFALPENPEFEATVQKIAGKDEPILVTCRSGGRSAAAIARLAKAGFTNVYNIVDGFEGDVVADADSYYIGKRMVNGWKNSAAPWTYALDPKLVYTLPK